MKAYYNGYQRQGKAKVHVVRETPVRPGWRATGFNRERTPQAWCGVLASDHTNSPKVPVDPTKPLEPGLSWCGSCLGRAADHVGLLGDLAALLVQRTETSWPSPYPLSPAVAGSPSRA